MRYLLFLLFAWPAYADTCPAARDITGDLSVLIDKARTAPTEAEGRKLSDAMWELWLDAPDQAAQNVLDQGMRRRESYNYVGALQSFDALIAYCPAYAEGYNQRAFVYFLSGAYEKALDDLDRTLDLSPDHVGAQSGRALTLMNLGQTEAARQQLEAALENNPWLSERFLLSEGGPLAPKGKAL